MPKSTRIPILMLEDNPLDAGLVQDELRRIGFVFTAKVVKTGKDFVRKLQESSREHHIILSDDDLPQYSGAIALFEAEEICPNTPFILVTWAREDHAMEIMNFGAKDYVLKSRLQQLVPAIRRALVRTTARSAESLVQSWIAGKAALERTANV